MHIIAILVSAALLAAPAQASPPTQASHVGERSLAVIPTPAVYSLADPKLAELNRFDLRTAALQSDQPDTAVPEESGTSEGDNPNQKKQHHRQPIAKGIAIVGLLALVVAGGFAGYLMYNCRGDRCEGE